MKIKKLLLVIGVIVLSLFTACEEPKEDTNPLSGTLWGYNSVDFIEFVGDKKVKVFGKSGEDEGTYKIIGKNKVSFENLSAVANFTPVEWHSATFTSNSLTVVYSQYGSNYTAVYVKQ